MARYGNTDIVPTTEGRTRLTGLDLNWTSASELLQTNNFSSSFVDAESGQLINIPELPSFNVLELSSPYTKEAIVLLRNWLKSNDAKPGKVKMTSIIDDQYTTFVGCAIVSYPILPSHDANAESTVAKFIKVSVKVFSTTKIDYLGSLFGVRRGV